MNGKRLSFLVVGITLLALGVSLVPGVAEAQERRVKVGGKAAFNSSRVRGDVISDDGVTIDFGTGSDFSLGGVIAVEAHDNVTFQPEFIFSRKKVDAALTVDGQSATGEIQSDFFEIPVLAKLHGSGGGDVRPFGLVGGTFSFLTGAEQSISFMGMTEVEDIKDELTSTDVGITFGGGVDFIQDWGVVSVDARYTLGLRTLDDAGVDQIKQDTFAVAGSVIF